MGCFVESSSTNETCCIQRSNFMRTTLLFFYRKRECGLQIVDLSIY